MDFMAGDDRREQGKVLAALSDASREIVADVFGGLNVSEATLRTVADARTRIHDQWGKAQTAALIIGKTLLDLSRKLNTEEYMAVRRGTDRLFPFSDSVATKLRRAAELAEYLRLPLEQSPSYTLLYEISTMPPAGQDLVKSRGLLRSDVTRAEILAVKAELKRHKISWSVIEHASEQGAKINLGEIETRRSVLLAEREVVVGKLAELDRQIAEITEQLRMLKP
jgi:hypothetical protein